MIDKEKAVKDVVQDYATGGSNLISGYEKERQKEVDTNNEKVEHHRQGLLSAFKKAQINQSKIRKTMSKRLTRDAEAEWDIQQQNLMAAAKAALGDCEEM